jgi:formylmethanofuran dehydrogenase subunit E
MSKLLPPDRWPTVADVTARCDEIAEQGIGRNEALAMAMDEARAVIRRLDQGAAEGTLAACAGCGRWVSLPTMVDRAGRLVCPRCAGGRS